MNLKREIGLHLGGFVIVFIILVLFKSWVTVEYWPFWVGGLLGTFLTDLDYILYVYLMRPYELTSQRVNFEVQRGNVLRAWSLLSETRTERRNLVFHSFFFQILFFGVTFLVVISSGNIFVRGLVLGVSLHLLVDQMIDLSVLRNLNNWFSRINLVLTYEQESIYYICAMVIFFILGIFL